jgi:hypothetical protein
MRDLILNDYGLALPSAGHCWLALQPAGYLLQGSGSAVVASAL